MKRFLYDLSHLCYQTGKLGTLKPIDIMHVNPGETFQVNLRGVIKTAPLRAPLTIDPHVHLAAYYVKHRHMYNWQETGTDNEWEKFIEAGYQYNSGGADALDTLQSVSPNTHWKCLPKTPNSGTIPAHLFRGFMAIWSHYYRIPNYTIEVESGDGFIDYDEHSPSNNDYFDEDWGLTCARLPEMWNTGLDDDMYDATTYATLSTASADITLMDIAAVQGEYQSEIMRDWFDKRYRDHMQGGWGSNGVTTDADARPEILGIEEGYLSGYNQNVTADSGSRDVGESIGISESMINLNIPPKYFNEHGCIWIVALVRFPSILEDHDGYLHNRTLTYENFAGDPRVISTQDPIELTKQDFDSLSGTNPSWGWHPYGQWWRCEPHSIDNRLAGVSGYPFTSANNIDSDLKRYYDIGAWDDNFFGTTSLWGGGHWLIQANCDVEAKRIIPPATDSIYAGAHIN
jgi:hypothetical protein